MSIDDTSHADERHQASTAFVQVSIIMRQSQLNMMNQMGAECGFKGHAELFFAALSLFSWALQEVKRGKRIASYDEATGDIELVHVPAFATFESFAREESNNKDLVRDVTVWKPWWKRFLGGA